MPTLVTDDASALHFNRLVKDVAIARSGVYLYTRSELPGLGIKEIPERYAKDSIFYVYRPAAVLAANKDKFARQPMTVRHPSGWVTDENFSQLGKGWTGDEVSVESSNDEIIIRSSVNLVDKLAIRDYDSGVREVSPGYIASFSWRDGITDKGVKYNIVMDDLESVNHLALVPQGRGGPTVRIMDAGDEVRKLTSGLFRFIKGLFVNDSPEEAKTFRQVIDEAIRNRSAMSDEDFDGIRDNLMPAIEDIPESADKTALKRMVHDLWSVKRLSDEGAQKYAGIVSDFYEKLDSDATKSVADAIGGTMDEKDKKEAEAVADEVSAPAVEDTAEHKEPDGDERPAEAVADQDAGQAGLTKLGDDFDNEFNDQDFGKWGKKFHERVQQLERSMTQIAAQMESFGTKIKEGVAAHQDATAVGNKKDASEGILSAPPIQVSDAAPVVQPIQVVTATLDSKPSKSPKGVDLEVFDKTLSNGGK